MAQNSGRPQPQWGQPPVQAPRRVDDRPLYKRKRVWGGGLLMLVLGSACGAAGSTDAKPAGEAVPGPKVTVTATATVTTKPKPAPTVTETVTETAEAEDSSDSYSGSGSSSTSGGSSSGGGGSVYYSNCSEARAAGAAPVHRGEPGYGSHLDRDGDGVGCDS